MSKEEYKVNEIFIAKGEATKLLYNLEEKRNALIKECAKEWQRLVEEQLGERPAFFKVALPTAFYDMMDSYETQSGIAACKFFLEKQGYKIIEPTKEAKKKCHTQ